LSRMRRPAALIAIAALGLSLALAGPPGQAQQATAATTADEAYLYDLFDVGEVGAEVVVAIDTSLSMREMFPEVRSAVGNFIDILEPGDRLTIITFDRRAKVVWRGRVDDKAKIKAALPRNPSLKGDRTDIGRAVGLVLTELKRGDGGLPVVVFLTDGKENPPSNSPFATDNEAAWAKLKERAGDRSARKAHVHGVGLEEATDIGLLSRIWPRAAPLTLDSSELSAYFTGLKDKIRRERLKHEVEKELEGGRIEARFEEREWGTVKAGDFEAAVTLKSHYRKLPVTITLGGASWERLEPVGKAGLSAPRPKFAGERRRVTLAPGETGRFNLKMRVPPVEGKIGPKSATNYRGRLRLDIGGTTRAAPAIADLGVEPKVRIAGRLQEIDFTRSIGQSLYLLAALALAVLVGGVVVGRYAAGGLYRRLAPPPLYGRLTFSAAPPGEPLPRPLSLENAGRRLTLGSEGKVILHGEDIKAVEAELFTRWHEGEPQVLIRPGEGKVRVSAKAHSAPTLITEPAPLKAGSVIQIGQYRIQWI
jgi:hypothetical protein